ncbi:hypothetical protein LCGC14_1922000 [marine sediment metagenome]|uniref:Uncharacterized protein n=1 Tax=marine sediment metagenome TaxID=412755 RepID=A0A0F9GDW7_9ZZZZ
MANRDAPISRVNLRSQVARFTRTTRGWGTNDIMSELSGDMQAQFARPGDPVEAYRGMIPTWWTVGGAPVRQQVRLIEDPVNADLPEFLYRQGGGNVIG